MTSIPAAHEESASHDLVPQELEPPVETQIAPEVSNHPARTSRVRELTKLKNLSLEEKQLIIEELKNGIENGFYKLRGKGLG
jgi:hypothetical protein